MGCTKIQGLKAFKGRVKSEAGLYGPRIVYSRVGAVLHPCSLSDPGDRGYRLVAASTVNSLANRFERGRDHDGLCRAQDGGAIPDGGENDGT